MPNWQNVSHVVSPLWTGQILVAANSLARPT
jgi:hypothetical protein